MSNTEVLRSMSLPELKRMVPNPTGSGEAAREARRARLAAGFSLDEVLAELRTR